MVAGCDKPVQVRFISKMNLAGPPDPVGTNPRTKPFHAAYEVTCNDEGAQMEITEVRVTLRDEEKLKAYASIVIDKCFIVKDLRIIDGNDRLWVAMPNKKRRDGTRRDVCHPLNQETRDMIESVVLERYDEEMRERLYGEKAVVAESE
jgi:stage V sporulation protein G